MYKEHPVFDSPEPEDMLWRYMDFTRFVSILDRRALFFARVDKLGDPFEGSLPVGNVEEFLELAGVNSDIPERQAAGSRLVGSMEELRRALRRLTVISCWHSSEYESDAMWRLYSREQDGIAIKTTFRDLKQSLVCSEPVYIGRV